MKRLILLFVIVSSSFLLGQFSQFPNPNQGNISGGLGLNWIDGKPHYSVKFFPEISFADFGVGLDLQLDFTSEGSLRTESFNEFSDYLSIIRYIRYGWKNDPVHIRVGALDRYTMGNGSIIYQYNNSPSFDARKIGMNVDINFGKFGIESLYGTFGQAGVIGLRGYVNPLQFTDLGSIPVLGSMEVGASFASDFNDNAAIVSGFYDKTKREFISLAEKKNLSIVGFDIGFPIQLSNVISTKIYFDYAKIIDFGDGAAAGIRFDFRGLGLISASAKLERRFMSDRYFPSYFNTMYEVERFRVDTSAGTFNSKARLLNVSTSSAGVYGELGMNVLGMFDIIGSYQRLDDAPQSGILHIGTAIEPESLPFVLRAGYDKINIKDEKDLFTLDDRSYLFVETGYKPYPFLLISLVYQWTYTPVRDGSDAIVGYEPQKRIEPRVSIIFPFNF